MGFERASIPHHCQQAVKKGELMYGQILRKGRGESMCICVGCAASLIPRDHRIEALYDSLFIFNEAVTAVTEEDQPAPGTVRIIRKTPIMLLWTAGGAA